MSNVKPARITHEKKNTRYKKVTMSDIAESLDISKNSVSLALNNRKGISEDLRARIVEKAIEMNYGGLTPMQSNRSRCIILIVPEYLQNDAFFYSEVFWGIEAESKNRGCISINTVITKDMEKNLVMPSIQNEIEVLGMLIIGIISLKYVEMLYQTGIPMATVDISYNSAPIGCIGSANLSGGYMAARHIIDCGHKRIGFVGPIFTAASIYERWCGYNLAMKTAGLASDADYNILGEDAGFELFDTIETLSPYLNKVNIYPTAWFCAGDRIAIAMINLLAKQGVRVPDDVSVIGFDDLAVSGMIMPGLTTIRIDRKLMGKLAVDYLFDKAMNNDSDTVNMTITGTLVVRDSVRKI